MTRSHQINALRIEQDYSMGDHAETVTEAISVDPKTPIGDVLEEYLVKQGNTRFSRVEFRVSPKPLDPLEPIVDDTTVW